ncbi:MAG: bifunctional alpha,alpha-trehalose-phosphate synthase (UDP-forming)/trehalose-phosphatase [Candidatus Neomarinimicrobiota bacterium]|nr:MAG: bifunctional alpha,alpha-trehalose-phosphate synthase (UDP-forming)/trehalose-phosphatase [Candidatus Neomarinimicrobiota bacterium]HDN58532.1 bifunctional alpha,alpha-trehalose-phosphate synthase (UDP-forming)/trehalose-phosphatase [Candidatus Neomarinimicrobiota bacterium]
MERERKSKVSMVVVVSNRLPVVISYKRDKLEIKPSPGGLVTGLNSVRKSRGTLWIGWPGLLGLKGDVKSSVYEILRIKDMVPVFLSREEYNRYYEGFSNKTIWPLFHYFTEYAEYEREYWDAYKRVNSKFAEIIIQNSDADSVIWVHDYHLMLLPGLLREANPDSRIGFFLHIPFPSFEIFRLLPWRDEILKGILGADLIGFHTYDYLRHFLSSVKHILGVEHVFNELIIDDRIVKVDTFPLGIDVDRFVHAESDIFVRKNIEKLEKKYSGRKVIISVDRLDYTKGIIQKLSSFDRFLEEYPEYRGKVVLVLIVVPSRWKVGYYRELKEDIDRYVGKINGKYSSVDWSPIQYFYRMFRQDELISFYKISDIAIVTPFRDGMNLVAKEFIASTWPKGGVLILSEMAGAAIELSEAIIVNPNNVGEIVAAIKSALEMSPVEAKEKAKVMLGKLKRYDVYRWVGDFLDSLDRVKELQKKSVSDLISGADIEVMLSKYREARKSIFFLDYDGTLVPFFRHIKQAKPDDEAIDIILRLGEIAEVVVISGRDKNTMDEWFGELPVNLTAEHGAWFKRKGKEWESVGEVHSDWKDEIRPLIEYYVDKTPGSTLEEKEFSIAWHYRNVNSDLGYMRERDLVENLSYMISGSNLQILEGNKVVEIKNAEVSKGRAVRKWLEMLGGDFIMAVGDDWTDEDMFKSLPDEAFTIKVGFGTTYARYRVKDFRGVRKLLLSFINK